MSIKLILISLVFFPMLLSVQSYGCPPQRVGEVCRGLLLVDNDSLRKLVRGESVVTKKGEVINSYADDIIDTQYVTAMNNLFVSRPVIYSIKNWNVSNVNNFKDMFSSSKDFNQDISGWNVSSGVNFSFMFRHAESFNQDISRWDTRNAENMDFMFSWAEEFDQNLTRWNVSKVTRRFGFGSHSKIWDDRSKLPYFLVW